MAITIQMLLDALGVIQTAKETSEAVGQVADNFDALGDTSLDATDRAKLALAELYRTELEQARATTVLYSEMTTDQQEEFRARYNSEADFQMASKELRDRRSDAESAVLDSMKQEYRRAFGDMERAAEDSSEAVGDSTEKGFERAEDAADRTGDNIKESVGGAFRDLDGTAEGALTSVTDGLAGLAATAGGVAGLVGAAAGTAGTLMVQEYFKAAEESEKRIESMYEAFLESGNTFYTDSQRQSAVQAFLGDESQMARAQRVAETLGVPLADAINALIDKNEINNGLLADAVRLRDEEFSNVEDLSTSEQSRLSALETTISFLEQINQEQDVATGKIELYNRVIAGAPGGYDEVIDRVGTLNEGLDRTAQPRVVPISVEVDLAEAESRVAEFIGRRRRVAVEVGAETGGRIIR